MGLVIEIDFPAVSASVVQHVVRSAASASVGKHCSSAAPRLHLDLMLEKLSTNVWGFVKGTK